MDHCSLIARLSDILAMDRIPSLGTTTGRKFPSRYSLIKPCQQEGWPKWCPWSSVLFRPPGIALFQIDGQGPSDIDSTCVISIVPTLSNAGAIFGK